MEKTFDLEYSQPPRKKLKRGIRSCLECRARKVKCQLTTEDVAVCAECIKAGIQCTTSAQSQLQPAIPQQSFNDKQETNQRLERIEQLLKDLKDSGAIPAQRPSAADTALPPAYTSPQLDYQGTLDVFTSVNNFDTAASHGFATSLAPTPGSTRAEATKRILLGLLPSEHDASLLEQNTEAWGFRAESSSTAGPKFQDASSTDGEQDPNASMNIPAIAQKLLHFAVFMQQLSPGFDETLLDRPDTAAAMRATLEAVATLVLSDDDYASSDEGLGCIILVATIHLNAGSLRKSMISFRRALNLARLRGLRDSYAIDVRDDTSLEAMGQRFTWLKVVMGDAFTSMLLGVEPGAGPIPFGSDGTWTDTSVDDIMNLQRRLSTVCALFGRRDFLNAKPQWEVTYQMEQCLRRIREISPDYLFRSVSSLSGRSAETAQGYATLMNQNWYYMIQIWVHLPYIDRAEGKEASLNSKERCLEAARIILHRYLGLIRGGLTMLHVKVVDIAAYVAVLTVFLTWAIEYDAGTGSPPHLENGSDLVLIEQAVDSLAWLGASNSRQHLAKRSAEVLSAMMSICLSSHELMTVDECPEVTQSADGKKILDDKSPQGMHEEIACAFRKMQGRNTRGSKMIALAFSRCPSAPLHSLQGDPTQTEFMTAAIPDLSWMTTLPAAHLPAWME